MKKNLEDSGKSKNRRKVKLYYWGSGMNIFFLEYKDKNFFCCLQTFFITGLTFSDRRKILSKTLLGCFGRKPDFFPDPVFLLLGYVEEYKKNYKVVMELITGWLPQEHI